MQYDVFNGDADGICALHQLRLATPCADAVLVTGVKRNITLLSSLQEVTDSTITVLDVSLDTNRPFLESILAQGNEVTYIDHHFAGKPPEHSSLICHIDTAPNICTSLIVNNTITRGLHPEWAIAGAFGDNLHEAARLLAQNLSLPDHRLAQLQELGELLNYNGYGETIEDLHFHPARLYKALQPYIDPFDFMDSSLELVSLRLGFEQDMGLALEQEVMNPDSSHRIYFFPEAPWARRVSGVFANLKARERQASAHALIIENSDKTLRISVRAPLTDKKNADSLCRLFPTGGGRSAAAGINNLPAQMLDTFISAFQSTFEQGRVPSPHCH